MKFRIQFYFAMRFFLIWSAIAIFCGALYRWKVERFLPGSIPLSFAVYAVAGFFLIATASLLASSRLAVSLRRLSERFVLIGQRNFQSLPASKNLSLPDAVTGELDLMEERIQFSCQNLERQNLFFFRFFPDQTLSIIDSDPLAHIEPGHSKKCNATLLHSRLRLSPAIDGKTEAEPFHFLTEYCKRITPEIEKTGGWIDHFNEEALFAVFSDEHRATRNEQILSTADRALLSAIEISRLNGDFNRDRLERKELPFESGIAIATGEVTVGVVGTDRKYFTTFTGTPVSSGQRLAGLTKTYQASLLITGETRDRLVHAEEHLMREVDTVRFGRTEAAVSLFEVFDAEPDEKKEKRQMTASLFSNAIREYKSGNFEAAEKIFLEAYHVDPDDRLIKIYIKRCREFRKSSPVHWDGVIKIHK